MSVLTNLYAARWASTLSGLYSILLHPIYMFTSVPQQLSWGLSRRLSSLLRPTLDNIHWRRYDKFYVGYSRGLVRPNPRFQNQKCCSLKWLFIVFYKTSIFHKIENLFSQVTKSININLVTKTFDKTL